MAIVYLTIEEIIEAHEEIIKATGGHSGILSFGNLDFLVSQSRIPKDIFRSAAVLFFGILTGHPFVDGNKRTATAILETFLSKNNKELTATDSEIWDVVHKISEGNLNFDGTLMWVKKNAK